MKKRVLALCTLMIAMFAVTRLNPGSEGAPPARDEAAKLELTVLPRPGSTLARIPIDSSREQKPAVEKAPIHARARTRPPSARPAAAQVALNK
ncbi:MAG TPA: hypothetical protein VM598_12195 [Bdellovibrionota bacterium]|nr:hypothetical protein [Bdellovibrionota bacterium]